ncbi:histone H2A-Bbd type 2/3-like [Manis pentadactyla]|uniref:histone H2A-Bbd type 2/3-like n=1 Tax=Manis pentadactyla TaxID=143292 RepID=UPI00255C4D30|nr:histone H2A-Bbd type 2/3-like [Manis pentadactyla]
MPPHHRARLVRENAPQPTPNMPQRRSRQASSGGQRRTRSSTRQAELHQRRTRSPTQQAELLFSVSQVERMLQEHYSFQHMSPRTPVFIAAIIQDLTAKILELVGIEAQKHGSSGITPEVMDMVLHSKPAVQQSLQRDCLLAGGPS